MRHHESQTELVSIRHFGKCIIVELVDNHEGPLAALQA